MGYQAREQFYSDNINQNFQVLGNIVVIIRAVEVYPSVLGRLKLKTWIIQFDNGLPHYHPIIILIFNLINCARSYSLGIN